MANDITIVIKALDQASGELKKITGDVQGLGRTSEETSRKLKRLGLGLSAMSALGGLFLVSATKLAARVETLGIVVDTVGKNAGYSTGQMREFERAIKSQGITLQATRQALSIMGQAQIDFTKGADLARIAQDAAVIANQDSSQSFQQLAYVIQTGNVLMARRLGLSVDFRGAIAAEAERLGKTVQTLTERERVQARTNAVIAAGVQIEGVYEASMTTAGKKMLSLNRHIEESRRILGEAFLPILADVVDGMTRALEKFEEMSKGGQRQIAVALGMTTAWTALGGAALLLAAKLPSLIAGIRAFSALSKGLLGPIGLLYVAITTIATAVKAYNAKINILRDTQAELFEQYMRGEITLAQYEQDLAAVERQYHGMTLAAARGRAEFDAINAAFGEAAFAMHSYAEGTEQWQRDALSYISAMEGERWELWQITQRGMEEEAKLMEEQIAKDHERTATMNLIARAVKSNLTPSIQEYNTKLARLREEETRLEDIRRRYPVDFARNLQWTRKYTIQLEETRTEIGKTEESLNDLTGQFLYAEAATGLEVDQARTLAAELGLLDDAFLISALMVQAWIEMEDKAIISTDQLVTRIRWLNEVLKAGLSVEQGISGLLPTGAAGAAISAAGLSIGFLGGPTPTGGIQQRQHGGPVEGAEAYLIGEGGPEIFVPGTSGKIYPLGSLAKGEKHGKFGGTLSGSIAPADETISQISEQQATMQRAIMTQSALMGNITSQQSRDMREMTRGQQAGTAEIAERLDRLIDLMEANPRRVGRQVLSATARAS
jgi:hypothetical protein